MLGLEQEVRSDWPFLLVADKSMLCILTVCKSAFGWPFLLVADKSMAHVLNSL